MSSVYRIKVSGNWLHLCHTAIAIWIYEYQLSIKEWGFRILSRYEWTGTTDKGLFKSTSMTVSRDVRNICMFRDHYAMMNSQLTLRKEKSICWLKKRFRGYPNKNLTFPTNRHCLNPILKSSNEKVMISPKLCFGRPNKFSHMQYISNTFILLLSQYFPPVDPTNLCANRDIDYQNYGFKEVVWPKCFGRHKCVFKHRRNAGRFMIKAAMKATNL